MSTDAIDVAHLERQRAWSRETFGPGTRKRGVIAHIRKELVEIEEDGDDTDEWIDVVILALDGAWRSGKEPHEIVAAIKAKQAKNERRTWPDWRTADPDDAIEHDRSGEAVTAADRPAAPAVHADEERVERMARALFEAAGNREPWLATLSDRRLLYRRLARAALAADRATDTVTSPKGAPKATTAGEAQAAVERVEAVVKRLEGLARHHQGQVEDTRSITFRTKHAGLRDAYEAAVTDLRAALDGGQS